MLLEASYPVSKRIAMTSEGHTITDSRIKFYCLDVVSVMRMKHLKKKKKKTENVPLSNKKISSHIGRMANDIFYVPD